MKPYSIHANELSLVDIQVVRMPRSFFPILSRVQAKCENLALVLPSYRNQLIDLQFSSIDLFLYDRSTSKSSSLL